MPAENSELPPICVPTGNSRSPMAPWFAPRQETGYVRCPAGWTFLRVESPPGRTRMSSLQANPSCCPCESRANQRSSVELREVTPLQSRQNF